MMESGNSRDVYLPGNDKWIDYQTSKVYNPGWNHIVCGDLPIVMMVKDGSAIPHTSVAQSTDKIDWNDIKWKKYLVEKAEANGLFFTPNMNSLQTMILE